MCYSQPLGDLEPFLPYNHPFHLLSLQVPLHASQAALSRQPIQDSHVVFLHLTGHWASYLPIYTLTTPVKTGTNAATVVLQ